MKDHSSWPGLNSRVEDHRPAVDVTPKDNELNFWPRVFLTSWRPYVWIVVAGILLWGRTMFFGYTFCDDDFIILDNQQFLGKVANIPDTFRGQYLQAYYRPLVTISLILDTQVSSGSALAYHTTNIILHLIASCLVFVLLTRLKFRRLVSFLCALVFVAHPLTTQAVAWIPGRNDSLLAVWILLSFIMMVKYFSTGSSLSYIFHALFFLLALLSKESAIAFPLVCLVYLALCAGDTLISKRTAALVAGWMGAGLAWMMLRSLAYHDSLSMLRGVSLVNLVQRLRPLVDLAGKTVVPVSLSGVGICTTTSTITGCVAIFIAVSTLVVFGKELSNRRALVGMAIFCLMLIPSFAVIDHRFDYLEERAYVSLIGFLFVLSTFAELLFKRAPAIGAVVLGGMLIAGTYQTCRYSSIFRDESAFWARIVEVRPALLEDDYIHLAKMYTRKQCDFGKAEAAFKGAISLNPRNSEYRNDLGILYAKEGNEQKAEESFFISTQLDPTNGNACYNLGVACCKRGSYLSAESLWKRSIEVQPGFLDSYYTLLQLLSAEQRKEEAMYYLKLLEGRGKPVPENIRRVVVSFKK